MRTNPARDFHPRPRSRATLRGTLVVIAVLVGCAPGTMGTSGEGDPRGEPRPPTPAADAGSPGPSDPPPGPDRSQPCPSDAEARFAEIVGLFEAELTANAIPGGAIAVVCGGRLAFAQGVGVRREGTTEAVTSETRFQLASTTKMFTAVAAAAMAEDEQVDLHAPVSTYLPFVSFGELTLHQLLSHTAGFPTEFETNSADLGRVVRANAGMAMWSPPGAVWNYSNPGYAVAGFALQEAGGQPFAELVRQHVTGPAGMDATMDAVEVEAGDFSHGHSRDSYYAGAPIPPDGAYYGTTYYGPMGGLWGSARDLGRWAEMHVQGGGAVLRRESLDEVRAPHSKTTYAGTEYGLGLFIDRGFRPTLYHHSGSVPGFLTEFQVAPEAGFGVAVLVNGDWYFPGEIAYEVQTRFVTLEYEARAPETGPESWPHYVGSYGDPHVFGHVDIVADGERLVARFRGESAEATLDPYYGDTYETTFRGERIDLTFWRDAPDSDAAYLVSGWGVAARSL